MAAFTPTAAFTLANTNIPMDESGDDRSGPQPVKIADPGKTSLTGNADLDSRTHSSMVHLQLIQAILEEKRILLATGGGLGEACRTPAEQTALRNTTQYTRFFGVGDAPRAGAGIRPRSPLSC